MCRLQIAFTFDISKYVQNLDGLDFRKAAVQAGLAVTARTHLFLRDLEAIESNSLPPLPQITCIVETHDALDPAAERLDR